jgi:hypothetical protein
MAKIGEKLWKNDLSLMGFILSRKGCRMEANTPLKTLWSGIVAE